MNNGYWEKRQVQNAYEVFENAEKKADEIAKAYQKASRYLQLAADQVFEKYQEKHGLTETDAMSLLNLMQDRTSLDELLQKLKADDKDESKKDLLAKLEAPAYAARLDKFRQLQIQINTIMTNVYNQELIENQRFYTNLAQESYYKSIFDIQQKADAAFEFAHVSAEKIDMLLNSRWSGKNYSERIWNNTQELAESLKEEMLVSMMTGRPDRETAEAISYKFAQGSSKARRLVRTESNYIFTEMNFESYKACGIKKYRYLATLDLRTCETHCVPLDGKIFLISERKIAENCPPMHPWCRCTVTAVTDEADIQRLQRSALDPETGKRIKIPASMTYAKWYKEYVQGKPNAELEQKKIKHVAEDRKQYKQYRKVVGKDAGKTLDAFQEMKYNKPEEWKDLKGYKKYLTDHPGNTKKDYKAQKALDKAGIKGIAKIKPEKIDTSEYTYDESHINTERSHQVSRAEAERFIKEADISLTRWNGRFVNYYSKDGATYVDVENKNIRTTFTSQEFDENTLKIREVAEKYAAKSKKNKVSAVKEGN
jgi:SPP1 gp7 family putative phage head morphogenesis protein